MSVLVPLRPSLYLIAGPAAKRKRGRRGTAATDGREAVVRRLAFTGLAGMNTSFFGELLQTISERGRDLIDRTRNRRGDAAARSQSLIELCEELLSGRPSSLRH